MSGYKTSTPKLSKATNSVPQPTATKSYLFSRLLSIQPPTPIY